MNPLRRLDGHILLRGELVNGAVEFDLRSGRISLVERTVCQSGSLPIIAPGLIDLHVHGFGGADPLSAVPGRGLAGMARALARTGTTAFQATLFPKAPKVLGADAETCWGLAKQIGCEPGVARILGLHLEGPFVNPLAAGALPLSDLAQISPRALSQILGPATGGGRGIRTMTLAPELPGARELVGELERAGVRASFGHSHATAAEARSAISARDSVPFGVTHLFNAMSGIHHRRPGLASLALTSDALGVELIGDLVHVGPEAIELALAARGAAAVALVSDALMGAGTGCDVFHSHGRDHVVHSGAAWYPVTQASSEQLAGSATGQLAAIRGLVGAGVVDLADALTMASFAPARALGLESEYGQLAPGAYADLIVLDPCSLDLHAVFVSGIEVSKAAAH